MRVFETRTANESELFSLLTCLRTTTLTLLSTFSPLGMISIKIWETPLSWHAKCSLPVAVRVSKTRVLKLLNVSSSSQKISSKTIADANSVVDTSPIEHSLNRECFGT